MRELTRYLRLLEKVPSSETTPAGNPRLESRATPEQIMQQRHVAEVIYDELFERVPRAMRLQPEHVHAALAELRRGSDLAAIIGSDSPAIQADQLHPWVWQAARSAWEAEQHEDAVDAADPLAHEAPGDSGELDENRRS